MILDGIKMLIRGLSGHLDGIRMVSLVLAIRRMLKFLWQWQVLNLLDRSAPVSTTRLS